MNKGIFIGSLILLATVTAVLWNRPERATLLPLTDEPNNQMGDDSRVSEPHALSIESLRKGSYPGSDLVTEQTLPDGSNYSRFVVSYRSEGNKIYALLTIPKGARPENGWPVIVFNHGYIPPAQYRTTERYIAYTDAFSRSGYILIRPDYRGHGSSEGQPVGAYGSNAYTIDVLNAVASVKKHPDADPDRIGMWGHSMGGFITLRAMVASGDVKAGVIWAGVVGSYADLVERWRRTTTTPTSTPPRVTLPSGRRWRQELMDRYGSPEANPAFWNSISATAFLSDISGPLQIHHGTADTSVPVGFSELLHSRMQEAGKTSELYIYPGDDHNLSGNLTTALNRSVSFFDRFVKGGESK